MIIEGIMTVIKGLLNVLFMPINIPPLPDEALNYVETLFDYLVSGGGIIANYTPLGYLMTLMGVIVAIDIGIMVYHFVMWIIRKIPVVSMS